MAKAKAGIKIMARVAPNKLTQEDFLNRVLNLHPNLDFSQSKYESSGTHVIVICANHGHIHMLPSALFKGRGCPKCSMIQNGRNKTQKASIDFINRCKIANSNFYSYENTIYTGMHSNISVTCPLHGDFITEANGHVRGRGCTKCGYEKLRNSPNFGGSGVYNKLTVLRDVDSRIYLYLFRIFNDQESFYKVGLSKAPKKRLSQIVRDSARVYSVEILYQEFGFLKDMFAKEQSIIESCSSYKPLSSFGGHTECMSAIPLILKPNIA